MPIHFLDSRLIQAAMLRMCAGLLFIGLAVAAHTAHSEEGSFAPGLDILTIQLARADADRLPAYQLDANVAFTRSPVAAPDWLGLTSPPQSRPATNPETDAAQATSSHWRQTYDNYLISLQRQLSIGFKFRGEQTSIALQPHSVVIHREQLKITFQPKSALIENGQFKIMFQPHLTSVTWGKAF